MSDLWPALTDDAFHQHWSGRPRREKYAAKGPAAGGRACLTDALRTWWSPDGPPAVEQRRKIRLSTTADRRHYTSALSPQHALLRRMRELLLDQAR
ncbi:hypothetical protein OG883_14115 [Streptomyces sp. NBC_01142]|uniref:hypothetical protein n=1 Tax=Streptomyces sp. NBC_01142 TaxID=2975865 RepID=UPI002251E03B|nr:hypothetical protein [Streptomyces sp. NBC_01142]MCX4821028.1 hypothetical protein [Streptomyces sp. NBC_01142]